MVFFDYFAIYFHQIQNEQSYKLLKQRNKTFKTY